MPLLRFVLPSIFGLILAAASCSTGSQGSGSTSASSSAGGDGGSQDDGPAVTCQNDPRVDTYVANLTKASASGALKITLSASDPAPPTVGLNTWSIKVADGAGAPVSNASIGVDLFMPDHGHGSSVVPSIAPQPSGEYAIKNLYFFMPGVWRITISLPGAGDGGAGESVQFFFCVSG